jgi:hypothetical protein
MKSSIAATDPRMKCEGGLKLEVKRVVTKDIHGQDVTMANIEFTGLVPPYLAKMLSEGIQCLIETIQEEFGDDAKFVAPTGTREEQKAAYEQAKECIGLPASSVYGDAKAAN